MAELGRRNAVGRVATSIAGVVPNAGLSVGRLLRSLNIWFWAIVGVPTLIAGVYYFAIASDLYVSEAKFVVHGPANASHESGSLASMLGGGTMESADVVEVRDYIESRDAARELERNDDLRAVLSRPEGDPVTRFPGVLYWRRDFESLYDAYKRFVTVKLDETSGIATLQVKAYRPEDAQRIAQVLMKYSERLVNQLNARAREDALSTFRGAVHTAEQQIAQVQQQLTAYRVKEKILDPKSASNGPLLLVSNLETELASTRGQLADMLRNAPRSPGIPLLQTRISSLEKLIADERSKITGGSNSVATKSAEYERLDVQRLLDEKALASAYASLEAARLQVQRQQLFLDEIAQPNLPDYPLYPKRLTSFGLVVASCFLAYGIAWLLVAGVREHASA